jgi:signal transduction histidine kinase
MLQHSRKSVGEKQLTDLNALAAEYLRLSYQGFRAKDKTFNVQLHIDFDESIGKVHIVPQDISRVLINLFNNAFYSVSRKQKLLNGDYQPAVWLRTKKLNNIIEIVIKDNGLGISERVKDKMFQPFFTTKPTGEGTGLGLSISYDIVTNEHGGEFKVKTKEGEYAEFAVLLPLKKDA